MADFNKSITKVLRHEGVQFDSSGNPIPGKTGWVNHPSDPGGETNYGITRGVALENGYNGPMKDIPFPKVMDIYKKQYWDKLRLDEVPDQDLATELFDTAVNCGVRVAGEFLQQALNCFNKKATLYPDLVEDGAIGPKSIKVFREALQVKAYYRLIILRAIDNLQGVRYIQLSRKKQKFETFTPGWYRTRVGVKGD